jgi:hypothetical protein
LIFSISRPPFWRGPDGEGSGGGDGGGVGVAIAAMSFAGIGIGIGVGGMITVGRVTGFRFLSAPRIKRLTANPPMIIAATTIKITGALLPFEFTRIHPIIKCVSTLK